MELNKDLKNLYQTLDKDNVKRFYPSYVANQYGIMSRLRTSLGPVAKSLEGNNDIDGNLKSIEVKGSASEGMVYKVSSNGNIDGDSTYLTHPDGIYIKRHVRLDNDGLIGLRDNYVYVDKSNEIEPEEILVTISCINDGQKMVEFRIDDKVVDLEPQKVAS